MRTEDRYTPPSDLCPNPEWWTSRDIEATENEVLELVHGLVRALQPEVVIETGTYVGDGTRAIATALVANGHGHLHTFELDPGIYGQAADNLADLDGWVTFHHGKAEDWTPMASIDFAFFDSSPGSRLMELKNLAPYMTARTIVAFHDTAPHLPLRDMLRQAPDIPAVTLIDLPTPRGISIGQLPRSMNA